MGEIGAGSLRDQCIRPLKSLSTADTAHAAVPIWLLVMVPVTDLLPGVAMHMGEADLRSQ
jgi:hypothetical protein